MIKNKKMTLISVLLEIGLKYPLKLYAFEVSDQSLFAMLLLTCDLCGATFDLCEAKY